MVSTYFAIIEKDDWFRHIFVNVCLSWITPISFDPNDMAYELKPLLNLSIQY